VEPIKEYFDHGIRCVNLGNPKEALVYFSKVLEIEPTHVESLLKKGHILGKLGKYQLAITAYDKVLQQEPNNILALINKGLALHFLQKYDDAIIYYDKVLKEKPESIITLYNKSSSLIKIGKTSEGLKILKDVIKADYSYKAKAKFDLDFSEIKTNNEFKKIIL